MELSPEERRRIYEEEAARIEAVAKLKSARVERASDWIGRATLCAIGLCLLVALLIGIGSVSSVPNKAARAASVSAPDPPLTEDEKYRRGCKVIRERIENKPMAEITIKDTELLQTCTLLGH